MQQFTCARQTVTALAVIVQLSFENWNIFKLLHFFCKAVNLQLHLPNPCPSDVHFRASMSLSFSNRWEQRVKSAHVCEYRVNCGNGVEAVFVLVDDDIYWECCEAALAPACHRKWQGNLVPCAASLQLDAWNWPLFLLHLSVSDTLLPSCFRSECCGCTVQVVRDWVRQKGWKLVIKPG